MTQNNDKAIDMTMVINRVLIDLSLLLLTTRLYLYGHFNTGVLAINIFMSALLNFDKLVGLYKLVYYTAASRGIQFFEKILYQ